MRSECGSALELGIAVDERIVNRMCDSPRLSRRFVRFVNGSVSGVMEGSLILGQRVSGGTDGCSRILVSGPALRAAK